MTGIQMRAESPLKRDQGAWHIFSGKRGLLGSVPHGTKQAKAEISPVPLFRQMQRGPRQAEASKSFRCYLAVLYLRRRAGRKRSMRRPIASASGIFRATAPP